ncbi:Gnk2-homologous domain protein [Raphanus sativus]|nr:Gnk2-homologous domain protein [Raphanus sativus]
MHLSKDPNFDSLTVMFQCRGDSYGSKCRTCADTAVAGFRKRCLRNKGGIIWLRTREKNEIGRYGLLLSRLKSSPRMDITEGKRSSTSEITVLVAMAKENAFAFTKKLGS